METNPQQRWERHRTTPYLHPGPGGTEPTGHYSTHTPQKVLGSAGRERPSYSLVRMDPVLHEGLDRLPHLCIASPPRGQFHTPLGVTCFPMAQAHLRIMMVFHVLFSGVTMGTHSSFEPRRHANACRRHFDASSIRVCERWPGQYPGATSIEPRWDRSERGSSGPARGWTPQASS